ncbi:MAG: alanine--tRNA ligase, partial [Myxococcota bacterium]
MTQSNELRSTFTGFFERNGHAHVASAPLIPANDPSLMFTNAGMVQFKDVFVGDETRDYRRATTSQKCMRVSGKHNDLEEVGRTTRHHTLFEMLGNFSFGDYFKELAIELAWKFVTEDVGLPKDRIWVTVFGGEDGIPADTEARALWKAIAGLPDERIVDMGMKDNFWAMGETGPCGPCSEIHLDTGSGPVGPEDFESGRVMEFWNLVFMQFQRRSKGAALEALPKPSVDTGMGLERLAALLSGADSTFHTDAFLPVIEATAERAGKTYRRSNNEDDVSLRVIADHARAAAFLVADGLQPSKTGRGYVMRRIMRRAIRHGRRLGFDEPFFHHACDQIVDLMGDAYPELRTARTLIGKVAENEEISFRRTLDTGLKLLAKEMASASESKVLAGTSVFLLYDTYGFPKDLTETIAEENGFDIDHDGFDQAMKVQKEGSKGENVGDEAVGEVYKALSQSLATPEFLGYPHESTELPERDGEWRRVDGTLELKCTVTGLVNSGESQNSAGPGAVELVLNPTPFYGESGGQVGDTGTVHGDGFEIRIDDTQKPAPGFTVARGEVLSGTVSVGDTVWAGYGVERRLATRAHHSATHIVHAALRDVLGDHVAQAGSLNAPDRLRFDYSHFESTTAAQLRAIEDNSNARVAADDVVLTEVLPFDEAKEKGAIALFGEKYGDVVRVVTMGNSVEFCGGTHSARTGEIEMVLLTREEAVSSGVRRVEAEVGSSARATARRLSGLLKEVGNILRGAGDAGDEPILQAVAKSVRQFESAATTLGDDAPKRAHGAPEVPDLPNPVRFAEARAVRDGWQTLTRLTNAKATDAAAIVESAGPAADVGGVLSSFAELAGLNREVERRLEIARARSAADQSTGLLERVVEIGGVNVLAVQAEGVDGKTIRGLADSVRDKLASG